MCQVLTDRPLEIKSFFMVDNFHDSVYNECSQKINRLSKRMKYTYQYRLYPVDQQKVTLNRWLRICRYWYNKQLGDRFDWWENNRTPINACPLVCSLPGLRDKPTYYSQKRYLPGLKKDLVSVGWSGELLDFSEVPALTLQQVCKRLETTFKRFIAGDCNGKRSGKPRFKSASRYRSLVFEGGGLELHSCSAPSGKYLYLKIPKLGLVKVRTHRHIPDGAILKQAQVIKKADGWYVNLYLDDPTVPVFKQDLVASTWSRKDAKYAKDGEETVLPRSRGLIASLCALAPWREDNSLGIDAVLHKDDFLATSDGEKLPSVKSYRRNHSRLSKVQTRKNARKKGSRARRRLAEREGREHQRIARSRKDHAYKSAHVLLRTGKQVFFHEKLNLKGLSKRSRPKSDGQGGYLPNGQSAKSGLNKSWKDAAFEQFFSILEYIAEKAGAVTIGVKPAYTSQLLSYRDEFVFTDCSIRIFFDPKEQLNIDRDINAAVNIKRVGLDVFPTINRRRGNPVVTKSTTSSTSKEVLPVFIKAAEKPTPGSGMIGPARQGRCRSVTAVKRSATATSCQIYCISPKR